MKAWQYSEFGGPEVIHLVDVARPEPAEDRVLLKIEATGLNPYDWHFYRGDPYLARMASPLKKSGPLVPGTDVAGVVEALGPGVTSLQVGDRVWGEINFGGMGEYATPLARHLTRLPESVSSVAAAATAMGALTAWDALKLAPTVEGASVLVTSASGGVGHLAAQIARIMGAQRVVGVASSRHSDWVDSLSLDRVIDYTETSLGDAGETFDIVVDTHATTPLREISRIMKPHGTYAVVGAPERGFLGPITPIYSRKFRSLFVPYSIEVVQASSSTANLDTIAGWLADGRLVPRVEKVYALAEGRDALEALEAGHVGGKVVVAP